MADLVVDSSVAINWFVAEIHSVEALRIYTRYQSGDITLFAPDLINIEITNVIWRKHLFGGMLDQDAQQILADFHAVGVNFTKMLFCFMTLTGLRLLIDAASTTDCILL